MPPCGSVANFRYTCVHRNYRPFFSGLFFAWMELMKICTFASGSSGNSLYLESRHSKILIDAGISLRRISRSLQSIGSGVDDLDAVVLSHEHEDHSRGVWSMPEMSVYVSEETVDFWKRKKSARKAEGGSRVRSSRGGMEAIKQFNSQTPFEINDLQITPFAVVHDAIDPVGFTVADGRSRVGVVTDIGRPTSLVVESLKNCDAVVIESNHDRDMLFSGPYPAYLKQRISGGHGHLSNEQAASLLEEVMHEGLKHVLLAHLSEKNNTPEMAFQRSLAVVRRNGACGGVSLRVAPRNEPGEVIEI